MRYALVLIALFLCIKSSFSQSVEASSKLAKSAKKMISAIVEYDYATYIDLTYPVVVERYGGKDIMVKMVKENKDGIKQNGMSLKGATFLEASPIVVGGENQLQSIVSFDYEVMISENLYGGTNYLLAVSSDLGDHWTFVELETYDEPSIKDFVPTYSDLLVFPTIYGAEYRGK